LGAPVGRAQHLDGGGGADTQDGESHTKHDAGQHELQQMPVAHRQHGELAAEIEDGELGTRLAEQRRIDGVAERGHDHADHHRGHEQLAADGRRPDGVVGAVRMADQQHDAVIWDDRGARSSETGHVTASAAGA
jgi:hypothetical protein